MSRHRNWCFTSFEQELHIDLNVLKYIIYQQERCPDTGKLHWQGYLELRNAKTMQQTKGLFQGEVHLEKRIGTQQQAIDYCRKLSTSIENTLFEYGNRGKGQGHRTDLDRVAHEIIEEKKTISEIAVSDPATFVRNTHGLRELKAIVDKRDAMKDRPQTVIVFWGKTGTGKTRTVYDQEGFENVFALHPATNGALWFDGYEGQRVLLLDDFYGWIKYSELLVILDRYPYRCQIKGGHTWAQWTTVYITSNQPPDDWYDIDVDISPLHRRITLVEHFE